MSTENKSFFQTIGSFNRNFRIASMMELLERWGWYGLFAVFAIYLVGSTDTGGLGFNHIEKGIIMTQITGILYFLPIFTGVIADRIGYKRSLIIAYLILISGYYFMGTVTTFWAMYFSFLYVAIGAALFKPVASAIITKNTDKSNSTLGFGIFYMMVNIGGFVGPAFSSALRNKFGWKIIFVQAAVVITINLLLVIFFYKEKDKVEVKESFIDSIKKSVLNIWEALKDTRLTVLLIIMIGFWTMFNQLFYTLPTFIEDWVDTSGMFNAINNFSSTLGGIVGSNGEINPEMMINIDAGSIVLFQIFISYLVLKWRHVGAMIRGFLIAILGIGITFYTSNGVFTILGIIIFAIGEMMTNPTFSSFIALISPKGKEALYMGTYFLPVAAGNFFTQLISGNLYQKWSDKLTLLQKEMSKRAIDMPEVGDSFSKNDYFKMASEKLGMTKHEVTSMLWDNYQPNKIWYVIVAIGLLTVLALYIYDLKVIRPKEKIAE